MDNVPVMQIFTPRIATMFKRADGLIEIDTDYECVVTAAGDLVGVQLSSADDPERLNYVRGNVQSIAIIARDRVKLLVAPE